MKTISRRGFLASSALALSGVAPDPRNIIGVQLYTVRSILDTKPAATLPALDQIGYREAEVVWASLDAIWADLKKTRLKPVSIHLDSALFMPENSGKLTAAISRCKELGFQYVVYPVESLRQSYDYLHKLKRA